MEKKKKKTKRIDKPLARTKAKQFTCIVCPTCCELETDGVKVNGALCPKGEGFALQEMVMPLRVVTTTVGAETPEGIRMIPVKTTAPVPMGRIFEIMKEIKALRLSEIPAVGTRFSTGAAMESIEWVVAGELE